MEQRYLDEIKNSNKPVVFVSGHFSNFELLGTKLNRLWN